MNRRTFLAALAAGTITAACREDRAKCPVKLGLLHSITGPAAFTEKRMIDGELLAIEEVNAAGGVLGRQVLPVLADGQSDQRIFTTEAVKLLTREKVAAIIGTASSADRKAVTGVVEQHGGLMFYPPAYEGLEESRHVIRTGAASNQRSLIAVQWFLGNRGKRFFLAGSDTVWGRSENSVIKDALKILGGQTIGEMYLPPHEVNTASLAAAIKDAKPDVVVSALSHAQVGFFSALRTHGVRPTETAILSLGLGEDMLRGMWPDEVVGSFAAASYFQSIDSQVNRRFVNAFRGRFGKHRRTDEAINNAYIAVHLWSAAARKAGTVHAADVREAAAGLRLDTPEGPVWVDETNGHLWRVIRIGEVTHAGEFEVLWASEVVIRPEPYPVSRTRREWRKMLDGLRSQ